MGTLACWVHQPTIFQDYPWVRNRTITRLCPLFAENGSNLNVSDSFWDKLRIQLVINCKQKKQTWHVRKQPPIIYAPISLLLSRVSTVDLFCHGWETASVATLGPLGASTNFKKFVRSTGCLGVDGDWWWSFIRKETEPGLSAKPINVYEMEKTTINRTCVAFIAEAFNLLCFLEAFRM